MAKKPKRQQRSSTDAPLPRTATSSSVKLNGARHNQPDSDRPKSRGERLKDVWVEVVVSGVLAAACVGLFFLWVGEWRAHEETKVKLRSEETAEQTVTAERDALKTQVAKLQKENAGLKKLHPILEFYAPHAKFTASYDLGKEVNSSIYLGKCPKEPCIVLTLLEITKSEDGTPQATLGVGGRWTNFEAREPALSLQQPIKRGCRSIFEAGPYLITFAIDEDRIHDMRVGVGVGIGDFRKGVYVHKQECPEL